jgi:2-phosphoglycolate phosphatase
VPDRPALPPRAVLFDFDGTLGDSYPAITASVNHVRALHHLPPITVAEVLPHVGRGPASLMQATVGTGDVEANVVAYKAHHPSVMREGTRLMPGVAEALPALRRLGARLGVCSNKPVAFTRQLLTWLGVAEHFDLVLGPEDVAFPKPAPDMLLAALNCLHFAPTEVLYVGDMVVDIQTARAAGVAVWVVATGSDRPETLAQAQPDALLRSLAELPVLASGAHSDTSRER